MAMPRSLGSSQVTLRSPIQIWPVSTSSRPAMALSSVDLPQPEGPSRTRNSPRSTSSDSRSNTRKALEGHGDVANRDRAHARQPFTAPAAMPRTNQRPEAK